MSSLVRTIQKSILKRIGYERQKERLVMRHGRPQVVRLKKGEGPILNPDGDSTGSRAWPRLTIKAEKLERRRSAYRPRKGRAVALNDCWLPPRDADKADLREMHREKMAIKKSKRRAA